MGALRSLLAPLSLLARPSLLAPRPMRHRDGRWACGSFRRQCAGHMSSGSRRSGDGVRVPRALRGSLVLLLGLTLGAGPSGDVAVPASGVDAATVPDLARSSLPLITELTTERCPELPPVWVVAQVEAESGWDPVAVGDEVAGLLQFDELTWTAAGGAPWPSPEPGPGTPVTDPAAHLRVAVP
jgi:hypothetical protein